MDELKRIDKHVKPDEVYLVVDAMIGQEAANVAKAFNDALELNACILTKLDGDARGGAALSIKGVTGVPIKFVGVGEKVDKLEDFVPERMAGRILGQGDLMGVVEKIAAIQKDISRRGDAEAAGSDRRRATSRSTMFREQFADDREDGHEGHDRPDARHVRDDSRGRRPGGGPEARPGHDRLDDEEGEGATRTSIDTPPPPAHRARAPASNRTR